MCFVQLHRECVIHLSTGFIKSSHNKNLRHLNRVSFLSLIWSIAPLIRISRFL